MTGRRRRKPQAELRIEYHDIQEIKRWPRNPKGHKDKEIESSIKRFGFVTPMVKDERTGQLVAGHGRLERLLAMHAKGDPVPKWIKVGLDGSWLAPVVCGVSFDNEAEAEAYLLADNKIGEAGGWNTEELSAMLTDLNAQEVDLSHLGFSRFDLAKMVTPVDPNKSTRDVGDGENDGDSDREGEDDFEDELPGEPVTQTGDVWTLGNHKILCGDSTKEADVDRLVGKKKAQMVLTDPPYAIYGSSTGIGSDIADDKMVRPFFEALFRMIVKRVPVFAHIYVNTDWRSWAAMLDASKRAGATVKNCIVWDKGSGGLGTNYLQCHEFIGFFIRMPPAKAMNTSERTGQRIVLGRDNVIRGVGRAKGDEREHNAAKPIALLTEFIQNGSDEGWTVLDLFGGSGSTMIACEKLNRKCLTMEIEPKWVDVMVNRWERITGKKAKRNA